MANKKKNSKKSLVQVIRKFDTTNKWFNIALVGLCFLFLLGIRLQTNTVTTGDEPHYLLMDYSMVHDHDLNLKNNYENSDYKSFFFSPLLPQGTPARQDGRTDALYAPHGIGLPVLLMPGYYLATKTGAVFEMVVLATLVVWLTWVWTKYITNSRKAAYLASFGLMICYFFNNLAGYIYPDLLIAATSLASLIIIEKYFKQRKYRLLLGFVAGFMILVHIKTLVFVLPLLAVLSYKLWRTERKLPWDTILITSLFIFYYYATYHVWFGVPSSIAIGSGGTSFDGSAVTNVAAMLFDSNRGLLVFNPITLLLFIGLPLWYKLRRNSLITLLFIVLPSLYVLSVFVQWNGGYAPAGRYIMNFLPLFVPAIAFAIQYLYKSWQKAVVAILAGLSLLLSIEASLTHIPLLDPNLSGTKNLLLDQIYRHTYWDIFYLFPSYTTTPANATMLVSRHGSVKQAMGYMLIIGLVIYGFYLSKSTPKKAIIK